VDETLFLEKEKELMESGGGSYSDEEQLRNNISFTFFAYKYDAQLKGGKPK